MTIYVPGTEETDLKKVIMSLQLLAENVEALAGGGGGGGLPAASQADQETGTSNAVAVTPGVQKYNKLHPKGWVIFNGAGTILDSAGIASVARTGVGQFTVTFATAFSSVNYGVQVSVDSSAGTALFGFYNTPATGSVKVTTLNNLFGVSDPTTCTVTCYGDQ